MSDLKHILIVSSEFPPQPGGIGNHAYNLAKHLQLNDFNVNVIADNRSFAGDEERQFDGNLRFKVHRVLRNKWRTLMYFKRVVLLFRLIKKSEIIIASGKFSLWMVAFCSIWYKRKYVAVIHGTEVNFKQKLLFMSIEGSLKRFSKIVAVSQFTKALVSTEIQKKVIVIPNGFDPSKWNSNQIEKLDLKGHPKLITVGNVTERKGQLNVINHLPELIKVYPQLHYHCVGIPTQKEAFLKEAQRLEVENYITFHGQVSDEKLQTILKACDIFVMLSSPTVTGDVEGFGIAILEANYFELPSIGAAGCGIEEAIHDHKSGIIVPHNDSNDMINALNDILERFNDYKTEAKKWAQLHDWQLIIDCYIKEIEQS